MESEDLAMNVPRADFKANSTLPALGMLSGGGYQSGLKAGYLRYKQPSSSRLQDTRKIKKAA